MFMVITRRCPFSRRQNWWSNIAFLIMRGRLFLFIAATRKARAAVAVFVNGTINKSSFEDRRDRAGSYSLMSSRKY